MKQRIKYSYLMIIVALLAGASILFLNRRLVRENDESSNEPSSSASNQSQEASVAYRNLNVPYINEAPDGVFKAPWNNACEEASIAMIESYYQGKTKASPEEAKEMMQNFFAYQDKKYGSNANSDAARTADIINQTTSFGAEAIDNPTLEQIKNELIHDRPVISFNNGKILGNKNIPFLAGGSYFHTMVIKGFDDEKMEFITNDDGDQVEGAGKRYSYRVFMDSLHDYSYETKKADGIARVIFTQNILR